MRPAQIRGRCDGLYKVGRNNRVTVDPSGEPNRNYNTTSGAWALFFNTAGNDNIALWARALNSDMTGGGSGYGDSWPQAAIGWHRSSARQATVEG
jgi:hypothetical protein